MPHNIKEIIIRSRERESARRAWAPQPPADQPPKRTKPV
jgi:hypothetical protein